MTREELQEYLVEEAEISSSRVEKMENWELVDEWLKYNGIINYTFDIMDVISAAYNVTLEQE